MKKLAIIFCAFIFGFSAIAQDYENAIKLRPAWLLMQPIEQLALQYERGLTDNVSAYVNVGYMFRTDFTKFDLNDAFRDATGLPDDQATFETIEFSDRTLTLDKIPLSGWHVGLGGRFYPQAEAIKRFYVGGKVSYTNTGFNNVTAKDEFDFDYEGDLKMNFINFGLEIGNQYIIADRVSIDWTILSFGISNTTVKANYFTTDSNRDFEADKADVDDWFSTQLDLPIGPDGSLEEIHESTVTEDGLEIKMNKFNLPYIRSGITLGFVF